MSFINPTVVAFVIALLVLGLAAVAWGADSRPASANYLAGRAA